MGKSRSKWKCLDCGVDTGKVGEHYFVHTSLWVSVVGSVNGMLCIGCFEKRLGRTLAADDFTDCHLNNISRGIKSRRLLNRLQNNMVRSNCD